MRLDMTRRGFLAASAGGIAAMSNVAGGGRIAHAAQPLTIVDWGPPFIDATREAFAEYGGSNATWVIHDGGAANVLAKIKAAWPSPPYDMIAAWRPVFLSMAREGWLEPITVEDVPHLKDVPERLIDKDEDGNWVSIPRSLTGAVFAYRPDICPIEINTLEDLFDPRLKGQIAWPHPLTYSNIQLLALAIHEGGSEENMDPGWDLLRKLAESGNIGRTFNSISEGITSLTTGETSISFMDGPSMLSVSRNVSLKFLSKHDESLKTFPWTEGWGILKSSKAKQEALDFANYTISPEVNTRINAAFGDGPVNTKSEPVEGLEYLSFNDEQLERFAYFPDFDLLSKNADAASKRFEQEIQPLL